MGRVQKSVALLKKRSTAIGAVGAACMLAAAVLVVQSSPRSELDVQLSDGAVWLASTAVGGVSLLDGGSGTIAASLGVADPGDEFTVEQFGSDAVIVNQTDGTVARLDGSSWEIPTGRVQFGVPGQPLSVVTGEDSGWLMTPGQATTVELEELALRTPIPVAAPFADGIITDDGALLYASTDPDLPVQRFEAVGGQSSNVAELDGPTALIDLGTSVAAVDLDDGSVWLEDAGTVCEQLEFPEGAELSAGGGEGLIMVISDQGGAFVWNPAQSGCPGATDFINLGPGTYGDPALTDGWAVIPEQSTSSVIIIDLEDRSITDRQTLEGVQAGTEVALIAEDGSIWYNDPASAQAGLIRRDGTIVPIAKYEEGATGFTSAPVNDAPEDADDMSLAGAQEDQVEEVAPEAESVAGPELTTTTLAGGGDVEELATTTTADAAGPDATDPTTATTDPGTTEPTTATTDPDTTDPITETTGGPTVTIDPAGGTTTSTTEEPAPQGLEISIGATAASVTAGESINFTVQIQHGTVNDFGTPTISPSGPQLLQAETIGQFRVLFPEPGTFVLSWTVCDVDDGTDCTTGLTQVTIVEDPDAIPLIAAIDGPATVVVGETASFRDISQGDPDSQTWSANTGATNTDGSGSTFDTSWTFPGPKQVTLTVGRGGVTRTATFDVDVVAAPVPAPFGLLCSPASLDIGGTATCQLDGTVGDFSDLQFSTSADGAAGFTSSSPSAGRLTLSSSQARNVTITLSATDNATGDAMTDTAVVTFNAPICAFVLPTVTVGGPSTLEVGTAGSFTGTPETGCGNSNRSWSATGGGSIANASAATTNISWASAGTYTVTYSFSDGGGSASRNMTVTVEDPIAGPTAPSISVTGASALETNESGSFGVNNSAGPIDSYSWTTNGGGGSGSGQNFSGSWSSAGSYTVTLSVTGPGGTDTATRSVTVSAPTPQASPFTMACDRASADTDTIFNCDFTSGNPEDFSSPTWSASSGTQTWLMSPWSFDAQGTVGGTTSTVTLTAVDLATGLTISVSDSVSITAPVVQPANMTVGCDQSSSVVNDIVTCFLTSGNESAFSGASWSVAGDHGRWAGASPFSLDVAGFSAGTLTITLSATDIATGQAVSASTTLSVSDPAPTPENLTIACSVGSASIGQRFNCALSSGNAGSFSGLTWTVSPAGNRQTWGGGGSLDIQGDVAGTLSIQLTGTDIATGQVVSASTSIVIS